MGDIQRSHITNHNFHVTSCECLNAAGTSTNINQDEKFMLDALIADVPCDYAELKDGARLGTERVPLTFENAAPNGAEKVLRGAEGQDPGDGELEAHHEGRMRY